MRDAERVRRSQSGVLLGLFTGVIACFVIWIPLIAAEKLTDWNAPLEPALLAGVVGFVAMLVGARWGQR